MPRHSIVGNGAAHFESRLAAHAGPGRPATPRNLATPTLVSLRRTHTTTSGTGHAVSRVAGHQRQPAARVRLAGPSNATRPGRGHRAPLPGVDTSSIRPNRAAGSNVDSRA